MIVILQIMQGHRPLPFHNGCYEIVTAVFLNHDPNDMNWLCMGYSIAFLMSPCLGNQLWQCL